MSIHLKKYTVREPRFEEIAVSRVQEHFRGSLKPHI